MAWLSRNNFVPSDALHSDDLNNLANDQRAWGGNVNGGGYTLSNVVIAGSQTPWKQNVDAANFTLNNLGSLGIGSGASAGVGVLIQSPAIGDAVTQINGSTNGSPGVTFQNDLGHALGLHIYGSARANPDISWLHSTVPIAFVMNNVEKMRLLVNGNLGIGTATPSEALSVNGAVRVLGSFQANKPSSGVLDFIGGYTRLISFGADAATSGGLQLMTIRGDGTGAAALVVLTPGGKVGIGTAAPTNFVSVVTTSPTTLGTAVQVAICEATNNPLYQFTLGYGVDAGVYKGVLQATNNGAGSPIVLNLAGGNVGVGLAAPGYSLDVAGDINCSGVLRTGGVAVAQTPWKSAINAAGFQLLNIAALCAGATATTPAAGILCFSPATDHVLNVRGDPAACGLPAGLKGPILQGVSSDQTQGEPITFFGGTFSFMAGSVGIGTTAPGAVLDVTGAVRFQAAVTTSNLPSANPGAGTKQLWYDPADGNRVKFAA